MHIYTHTLSFLSVTFLLSHIYTHTSQGPKLRVGVFGADKVILTDGQSFVFDMSEEPGDACRVRLPHPEILNTLRVGDFLLLGTESRSEVLQHFIPIFVWSKIYVIREDILNVGRIFFTNSTLYNVLHTDS
jgi:hypothetical protein